MVRHPLARLAGLASCLAVLAVTTPVAAQTGSSLDVITGSVTDSAGRAVINAAVEVYAVETQVTRKTTTNTQGRYTIFFNDGGGQYRVTITMIGKRPFIANVSRQADDDRIMLNVQMGDQPTVLQDIVTTANRGNLLGGREAPTPGSIERAFTAEQALRLPIDVSDLTALAALVPGVIVTPGTDSTAAQFSIAGQSGLANNYTVDGLSFAGDALPQDAIRSTRVISSTFDVARGQFSGGSISASTRRGSNVVSGSASGNLSDDKLSIGGTGNVFDQGRTQQRLSGGYGGPIVRDKLFVFGSLQMDRSLSPVTSLSAANATTATRLGASPDSVARFISLVNATGLTSMAGPIDPTATSGRWTGMLRLDGNLADRHSFSFRGDLRLNDQEPSRIASSQLPQVGGVTDGNGGGLALSFFSRLGVSVTNELRAGYTTDKSTSTPFLSLPGGRVQNVSLLDGGVTSTSTFGFGGNTGLPQSSTTRGLELTEEVSFFSPAASHRYRMGLLYNTQSFSQDITSNRYGTYTYSSLAAFQDNIPSQFTRTLSPTIRDGSSNNTAFYVSDVWRPSSNLQLTYGGRVERSWFGGAPDRNVAAEERFGVRTDVLPTETYFTPRFGFSYSIAASEQRGQSQRGFAPPLLTIRGGLGLFRGTMPSTLAGTAQAQSGLANTEAQLICVGDAVPLVDWNALGSGGGTIPVACDGVATPARTGVPNITTYASDYGAAKTWRASLGASKRFWNTWSLNVDGSYTRGLDQSATRDLNLRTAPVFSLSGEDGRPVYADPTRIVTTTGAVPLSASRIDDDYGRVNLVTSGLENKTTQFTASVATQLRRGASINLSYSWMRSSDQGGTGGGGGGFGGGRGGAGGGFATSGSIATAGDPNAFVWARASNDRTHNIQVNVTWPFTAAFEVTAIGRVTSGGRYTPVVQGDINGDGAQRNDIAYVYNPAVAADPEVAAGMDRLLNSLDGNARQCLESQLGRVAERNSCVGPWQPSLDMQVNWRPGMFQNRLALSFSTVNLLGGLDQLFHGSQDLHGWGINAQPDATLLRVTGFDATTRQFQYVVNERFGATGGSVTAVRSPFQVALQGRYTIGFDRRLQMQRGFFGGGQQQSLADQMLGRIDSISPHPAKAALERKDSLALDSRQVAALQQLADSGDAKLKPMLDTMRTAIEAMGTNPDMAKLFELMAPIITTLREFQTTGLEAVRGVLTDAQWALLPETVRNPDLRTNPFFGGGRGGQPGAGGPPGGGGGFGGGRRGGGRDGGDF